MSALLRTCPTCTRYVGEDPCPACDVPAGPRPLGVGLHERVSEQRYHADPCVVPALSPSIAHVLLTRSAAHAYAAHPRLGGHRREPSAEMARGTLIHALLLGGAEIVEVRADDWRTKAAREARDNARRRGEIPVLAHELAAAVAAVEAIAPQLPTWLRSDAEGSREVTAVWESDGVLCRGRLDSMRYGWLDSMRYDWSMEVVDIKTTRDASPDAITAAVARYGYDVQAAAYTEAIETLRPEVDGRVRYGLIFLELEPPYAVTLATLSGEYLERGRLRWQRARETWAACLAAREWPAYGETILHPPRWASAQAELTEVEW